MALILPTALRDMMRDAARAFPEQEICGLLLGEGLRMTALLPAANISADPATRFEIDPAVLIKAHKAARDGSPKIIGCYHSHPNGSAEPSMRDAEAAENGSVWVVIAGDTLTAWQFGAEGFVPLPILPS